MIKLRLIGASAALDHLILTSRKQGRRGSHIAPIDDKLFRVLEDVVRKRRARDRGQQARPRTVESKLSPRDVQKLLRAGRSPDQVARLAGVDVTWVERFLGPILYERAGAIQDCRRARLEKPRLGVSGASLGESVMRNLQARRVKMTEEELDAAWDASRLDTQPWLISLAFRYRGREQRAMWRYDPQTREVAAANRLGSELGWIANGRRAAARRAVARPKRASKPKRAAKPRRASRPKRAAKPKRASRPKRAAKPKRSAAGPRRAKPRGRSARRPSRRAVAARPRRARGRSRR